MIVFTPVIFFVNQLSLGLLFLLRIDPNKKRDAITEDELRTIVEVSHEEGVIEKVMPKVKPDTNAAEILAYLNGEVS